MAIRSRGRSRSNAGGTAAEFSPRTGHARLRLALPRGADHPRVAPHATAVSKSVGEEHLRSNRSFVLVANHSSHLDTVCLLAGLPLRRLHRAFPAAAADYFFKSVPRTWIATVVVNALPFARQTHVRQSLAICGELLANAGNILIIFPEGTRSTTGRASGIQGRHRCARGRPGCSGVLPCYLDGAFRAWPKGSRWPRPRKVRLIIGAPRNYASRRRRTKSASAAIAEELHDAVRRNWEPSCR